MASRYWVGGTGSWQTTTNWSATSGGSGGASIPTSADDVFFNASSGTGTVTIAGVVNCLSLDTTGVSTSLLFNATGNIYCYGNLNLGVNTRLSGSLGFQIFMSATTTGKTVSCSTASPVINAIYFGDSNGVISSGGWSLSTSITATSVIFYTGTLNTNGQTVTVGDVFGDQGVAFTVARTLTLGASTINCGTVAVSTSGSAVQRGTFYSCYYQTTGFTFNAGTSTINIGSVSNNSGSTILGINSSGLIQSESYASTFSTVNIYGLVLEIHGTNTYTNLNVTAAQIGTYASGWISSQNLSIFANQTVTGTMALQGSSASLQRLFVQSGVIGSPITITTSNATASTKTLKWASFQDITFTNTGSALGPLTLVGNAGGCTAPAGTFDAAITCYAKPAANNDLWTSAIWYTTSGGTTAARVPLPQDDVVFDANSTNFNVIADYPHLCANINTSAYTSYIFNNNPFRLVYLYGELTCTNSSYQMGTIFSPRRNVNIGSANFTTNYETAYSNPGFTVTLTTNFTNTSFLRVIAGTFTTNNFNVTTNYFDIYSDTTPLVVTKPTVNFGSSTITIAGNAANYISFGSGVTCNAGTSTIVLNRSATNGTTDLALRGQTIYNVVLNATTVSTDYNVNGFGFLATGGTINSITSTGTAPCYLNIYQSTTWTFNSFNLVGTQNASIFIISGYLANASIGFNGYTSTIAVANNSSTSYVSYMGITKSGAGVLSASGVANISRNSGITFTSTVAGLAYTGQVGTSRTGSFIVPANYTGSNLCIVYGGGGGAARRTAGGAGGGGAGGMAIFSNLNNVSTGSTIYYQAGAGGTGGTSTGVAGGSGATSWLNTTANTSPTAISNGIYAGGASGSPTNGTGASGVTSGTCQSQIKINSGDGGSWETTSQSGGGGGAAPTLYAIWGYPAGTPGNTAQAGGVGGGGAKGAGANSTAAAGGAGGLNLSSSSAGGGSAGLAGTAGTLGGGGGGGGQATSTNTSGGAGGDSGYGGEYSITQLNGTGISSTLFGGSGGGGGGGSGNGTGTGGVGGSPSIAGGGGGGGSGGFAGTTGNGGNGGVGAVIFLYTVGASINARSYGLLVG